MGLGADAYPPIVSVSRVTNCCAEPARPKRRVAGYVVAVVGPIALAFVLVPFRDSLRSSTVGFAFVVIVVIAASLGRVGPGIVASIEGFLIFNFLFLPPFGTFVIERPEDVTALFVFLGLSILISILFARAAERADAAEAREAELRTLQELSRDLVVQGPGEETYRALLESLVQEFGFDAGALFVQEQGEGLVELMAVGAEAGTMTPTWDPSSPGRAPERLPLSVGRRNLGLIVLVGERPALDSPESRVIRAVCDQLALVLERDRLLRTATEAEIFRQTDQIRRSMLAAVSHDLRSPLAAIKASVTDLLDPEVRRPEAEQREVLRTIDTETDRLDMLVANLLDMSRIEAGVLQAKPESVDLAEVVDEGGRRRRRPLARHPRSTRRSTSGTHQPRADPVFLDRVLVEPAGQRGPRLRRGRACRGRGPRGRPRQRRCDGAGGRPRPRRRSGGARAALLPLLPVGGEDVEAGARAGPRHLEGVRRPDGRRALDRGHARRRGHVRVLAARGRFVTRILVIDDEAHIRRAVERALAARGYEVDAAEDGADALDRAALAPPTW